MKHSGMPAISFTLMVMIILMVSISPAAADTVVLPNTFSSGTPAVAAEVNANFDAVKTAVDDNDSRITALDVDQTTLQSTVEALIDRIETLEATVATLQTQLAEVEGSQVMALEDYLAVDDLSDPRGALIRISGANVRIDNGAGSTDTVNGLGNLIIGYDEENTQTYIEYCSDGQYDVQGDCEDNGAVWAHTHKNGSHNLVLGSENSYSQYGGLVAGKNNFITRGYNTITGGFRCTASGQISHVSGGSFNHAIGMYSTVAGGSANWASGDYSSAVGGHQSGAQGDYSTISGGNYNIADGDYASVTGGRSNSAIGQTSTVTGGTGNEANGMMSVVAGGNTNIASGDYAVVSGGYTNTAGGNYSSVSGGYTNNASGYAGSVSGGISNEAGGNYSSVSGGSSAEASTTSSWAAGSLLEE